MRERFISLGLNQPPENQPSVPEETPAEDLVEITEYNSAGESQVRRVSKEEAEAIRRAGVEQETSESIEKDPSIDNLCQDVTEAVITEAQEQPNLTQEQKQELNSPSFREKITETIKNQKFFSKSLKEAAVDFAMGAVAGATLKGVVKAAARIAIKRSLDIGTVGAGVIAGAASGAAWEFSKTTYQELKRVKQEKIVHKQELKNILGPGERFKNIIENRSQEDIQSLDEQSREIYEKLKASKVNWKKVGGKTLKGALVGAVGGAAGGYISEHFGWGGGGSSGKAASPEWFKHLGKTDIPASSLKIETVPSDVTEDMHKNVWNTVKEYLKQHGINKPSNALVNEATRKITDLNNIEITGDNATKAAEALHHHVAEGVKDIAMQDKLELHHFEALNDLIKNAHGTVETVVSQVEVPGVSGLPKAGLPPNLPELKPLEKLANIQNLKNLGKILASVGIAASVGTYSYSKIREGLKQKVSSSEFPVSSNESPDQETPLAEEEKPKEGLEQALDEAQSKFDEAKKILEDAGTALAIPISVERCENKLDELWDFWLPAARAYPEEYEDQLRPIYSNYYSELEKSAAAVENWLEQTKARLKNETLVEGEEAKNLEPEPHEQSMSELFEPTPTPALPVADSEQGQGSNQTDLNDDYEESSLSGEKLKRRLPWQKEIVHSARQKGINLGEVELRTWGLLQKDKEHGGPLWTAVEKGKLTNEEALFIQEQLFEVKDWTRVGNYEPLERIFELLLNKKQTNPLKTLLGELTKLSDAMRIARRNVEARNKKIK